MQHAGGGPNSFTNFNSSLTQSQHVISAEQLIHVLADSNEQTIDGYLTINGMSYRLIKDEMSRS